MTEKHVEWVPQNDRQHEPFRPGNTMAVTHGAYSTARTDPIAQRYVDEIGSDPATAYFAAPRFHAMLWAWATLMAQAECVGVWMQGMSIEQRAYSDRGQTSPLELQRKFLSTAASLADKMGLTPASSMRIAKDYAGTQQADAATLLTKARADAEAANKKGTAH